MMFSIIILTIIATCYFPTALGGDCNAINPSFVRYYFDRKSTKCIKFDLKHNPPVAPTNIFDEAILCEKKCGKSAVDARCKSKGITSKSAGQTVYKFQKDTLNNEACVAKTPFPTYATFPTTYNAFKTNKECSDACLKTGKCTSTLPPKANKYYFNGKQCAPISANVPTLPGSNLFDTDQECIASCIKLPVARCTPTNVNNQVFPTGQPAYSYNTAGRVPRCAVSTYKGYRTRTTGINFFNDLGTCTRTCRRTNLSPVCTINLSTKSYYFDGTKCVSITLTDSINPQSNAFFNKADCETNCLPKPETRCVPKAKDKKVDSTSANQVYYTFDVASSSCKSFQYSGYITPPSNLNVFTNAADCAKGCGKDARCTVVDPPVSNGKYYFDGKRCVQVDVAVPIQSDSNVFDSETECKDLCDPQPLAECFIEDPNKKATPDSVNTKAFTFDSKSNQCKAETYKGVVNIPATSNFFNNKLECEKQCVKSTTTVTSTSPGQTTVPSSSPGPSLPDADGRCCAWAAIGECERNGPWMKSRCQVSCGTPNATRINAVLRVSNPPAQCQIPNAPFAQGNCKDLDVRCWAWRRLGECFKNAPYMQSRCKATCSYCDAKPQDFYPGCKKSTKVCKNQNDYCCYWQDTGECTKNPSFMNANCPAACNTCGLAKAASGATTAQKTQISASVISGGGLASSGLTSSVINSGGLTSGVLNTGGLTSGNVASNSLNAGVQTNLLLAALLGSGKK